jgi:hypothetical protein
MSLYQDLEDYKLQTEFDRGRNTVLHRSYRADRAHGRQRIVVEERWASQKPMLGAGSFGTVRLEKLQDDNAETQFRAVKQLRKVDMERTKVDFRKELLALTKFSRSKVGEASYFFCISGLITICSLFNPKPLSNSSDGSKTIIIYTSPWSTSNTALWINSFQKHYRKAMPGILPSSCLKG